MKLEKELKDKINYIFDIFEKNNIKEVEVGFYGSGDDGTMEISNAYLNVPEGTLRERQVVFADKFDWDEPTIFGNSIYELVQDVTDNILDKKGVDYANGNGNEGCVTYTVKDKNISMSYLVTEDAYYDFSVK